MADFSSMLTFAPELLRNLPQIFLIVQIVYYLFFIRVFGWIIMKGFRGYLPWHIKLVAQLGFGFIAVISAVALSPFIPVEGTGIFRFIYVFFQINTIIAGIISTTVFTVSLYLISYKIYNIRGMEKAMEKLKLRMEKAKSVEKEMAGKTIIQRLMQPVMLAGILIFAGFLIFTLVNFRGFPNPTENVLSTIGLNQSDIDKLVGYIEAVSPNETASMPEGCVSPLELAQNYQQAIVRNELPVYADSGIKSLIESNSGETVELMYRIEYEQRVYALAITTKQSICSATGTVFCGCVNLGSMV